MARTLPEGGAKDFRRASGGGHLRRREEKTTHVTPPTSDLRPQTSDTRPQTERLQTVELGNVARTVPERGGRRDLRSQEFRHTLPPGRRRTSDLRPQDLRPQTSRLEIEDRKTSDLKPRQRGTHTAGGRREEHLGSREFRLQTSRLGSQEVRLQTSRRQLGGGLQISD